MNTVAIIALILFILTYVLMIVLSEKRTYVAVASALIFILLGLFGVLPRVSILSAIDFNVILMLAGTMCTVSLFISSKMPNRMADMLLGLCPNVMWVAVVMSLFAGIVSAFIDNVATVLMIAPVALAIAKKLNISPVAMLICISVSSNLQGAATLVGDTTSIMLGGYAGMDFTDFFVSEGRASIFWFVELGAIITIPVIMYIFRDQKEKVEKVALTKVDDMAPTFFLLLNVILLILASFVQNKPEITNGIICICISIAALITNYVKNKDFGVIKRAVSDVDFMTLFLLSGLFIVIEGIKQAGIIDKISELFVRFGGGSVFLMYTLIVWGSVIFSAFIDNIPYVATMLPVVQGISYMMGCNSKLLYFGLLIGATLGGNMTPIGASANIATIGMLRKEGYSVKNGEFMRIGIPFTLVAVFSGYVVCWLVWSR